MSSSLSSALGANRGPAPQPSPSTPTYFNPTYESGVGIPGGPTWVSGGFPSFGSVPAPIANYSMFSTSPMALGAFSSANPFFTAYLNGGASTFYSGMHGLFGC